MKPISIVSLVTVLVVLFSHIGSAETSAAPNPEIEKSIRDVLHSQQEAWNRGDIDAFMNGYAKSESTTFVSEDKVTRGWETVRNRYHERYSDRAKMGQLTFADLEIMPLGKDSALVLGSW